MQLLADGVVLAAVADQLAHPAFELGVLFAQRDDLPLGDRDRVPAVRMRHEDLGEEVGVIGEELRALLQVLGDGRGIHPGFPVVWSWSSNLVVRCVPA